MKWLVVLAVRKEKAKVLLSLAHRKNPPVQARIKKYNLISLAFIKTGFKSVFYFYYTLKAICKLLIL